VPGGLERERLAEGLVRAPGLQGSAVFGQDGSQEAPGARVRGTELEQEQQLVDGLVVFGQGLQRPRPQETGAARAGMPGQQPAREVDGQGGVPRLEMGFGLLEGGVVLPTEGRLGPVRQLERALVLLDRAQGIVGSLAQRRRQTDGGKLLEPLARLGQPAHASLESGRGDGHALPPVGVLAQGQQRPVGQRQHLVAPLPALRALRMQLEQVHVGQPAPIVESERPAIVNLRLPARAQLGQRKPEVVGDVGRPRIQRMGAAQEIHRPSHIPRQQLRLPRLVIPLRRHRIRRPLLHRPRIG
jgi:hypothetical protein